MSAEKLEKIYRKASQIEHILLRPDSYVGSVECREEITWIKDDSTGRFVNKSIKFPPGLFKIFDEILVNASDNYQRDKRMNGLRVKVGNDKISVWNNGKAIPIQIHKEHQVYIPELIFGHLLTSSNFDDSQKKVTGGRNGFGAKLANVFSKKFQVEIGDSSSKKLFRKTWLNNMKESLDAEIVDYDGESYTLIEFKPDLKKFGIKEISPDIQHLFEKRVYDLAGILSGRVKVSFNNKQIPIKSFLEYSKLYFSSDEIELAQDKSADTNRWEILVGVSDGQMQHASFVNGINTSRGGTHVNYIANQISENLVSQISKKNKNINVKPFQVKNYLWLFINSLIENPAFDSQTKETLTSKITDFGSEYLVTEKLMKSLTKIGIVDTILNSFRNKDLEKLNKALSSKKTSKLLGIPKLEDANEAGNKMSNRCTLILTEGDSAKALAMAGIEVVGRDYYGVFPLKGKILNVRDCNTKQILDNPEIQNLVKILGLQMRKEYKSVDGLRYGSVMIMADQDVDGSHIKGLVFNIFHYFWPSLLQIPGFLKVFITPLVKVIHNKEVHSFFSMQDFQIWAEGHKDENFKVKYYKGLGTSTSKEAKEYFSDLQTHIISTKFDQTSDDSMFSLAFSSKCVNERKEWLSNYNSANTFDFNIKTMNFQDFFNKEMIHFSNYDNIRSIPSLIDGLKPGQRKILFSCFKRNLKSEIKVAQLTGYVAEHSAYHHGEMSLSQTIIGMAQNYVGANNLPLMMPIGQFGSRAAAGKDFASPRYIFTNLSAFTRFIFCEDDDHVVNYLDDDGMKVEPEFYVPIIPMILVNGTEGIGTGWSTSVPSFDPIAIIENLRMKINNLAVDYETLNAYFRGYKGTIDMNTEKNSIFVKGKFRKINSHTIEIQEIPIFKSIRDYKDFLHTLVEGENAMIDEIRENHFGDSVSFTLHLKSEIESYSDEEIEKIFRLNSKLSTNNMVLFNSKGNLRRYAEVKEIFDEFFEVRLSYYSKRKAYLTSKIQRETEILHNKMQFIRLLQSQELKLTGANKEELSKELKEFGLQSFGNITKVISTKYSDTDSKDSHEFNYLLSLPIWTLTKERVEQMASDFEKKTEELKQIREKSPEDIWLNDLEALETEILRYFQSMSNLEESSLEAKKKSARNGEVQLTQVNKRNFSTVKEPKKIVQNEKRGKTNTKTKEEFIIGKYLSPSPLPSVEPETKTQVKKMDIEDEDCFPIKKKKLVIDSDSE